jgi:uncharacterized membrane protein
MIADPIVVFIAAAGIVLLSFALIDRVSARRHRRFETLPLDEDVTERFTAGEIVESHAERKTPIGRITLAKRRR